jgi:GT2 family glycosyltransferase
MSSPTTPAAEVLVVIVNYNGGELLVRSVEAMKRQTFAGYRLVVVDNASTDDSIERLRQTRPEVEVLAAGANLGFAAANNLAVRSAGGTRWIALLNPDAFPQPDWLQRLVEAARRFPGFDAFASRTMDASNPELIDGAGDAYHLCGRYWRRGYRCLSAAQHLERKEIFSASGAAALYSRAAWDEAGGLDEDFFCYGEDVDLGFRFQLSGRRCLYVPEAVALHHGSAVTGWRSDFSTYHGQRNLVWVYTKNMPSVLFWLLLPCHVALNAGAFFVCVLRGQGRVAFKAKLDALRGLPLVWRKRSAIQRSRRASMGQIWRLLERGWPAPRC